MHRAFYGLAAVICLTLGIGYSATLIPAAPVTRVRVEAGPVPTYRQAPTTTTTIDWPAGARYAAALDTRARAIWYAVAWYAHRPVGAVRQVRKARRDYRVAAPTRSAPSGDCAWADGAFQAIWGARASWAETTARGESGCSVTARNPAPCNARGDHAVGAMQICGYNGSLDIWSELRAAWQLCLVQPDAWGYHGSCR